MVYLIHFHKKLHHAQHYIGFVEDGGLVKRMIRHRQGIGARILVAFNNGGIKYSVVRLWREKDRSFERKLKNRKKSWELCPVCKNELL